MITLEEACEIYESVYDSPIEAIADTDTEWAFYPATGDFMCGVMIPVVNKKNGELTRERMFDYYDCPEVPIPQRFVKPLPEVLYTPDDIAMFHKTFEKLGIIPTVVD